MPWAEEVDRLRYEEGRRHRPSEITSTLADLRQQDQRWNSQGHRRDCVCRTCFEAWLEEQKRA